MTQRQQKPMRARTVNGLMRLVQEDTGKDLTAPIVYHRHGRMVQIFQSDSLHEDIPFIEDQHAVLK